MAKAWWKEAFGYQIYIRSFFDGNNDGIGDLPGITEKLPYLHYLGVDIIWICPFYASKMVDGGYDVSDYYKVASEYGTLDDFKTLLVKAARFKIKVFMELVLNHTADNHIWFLESRKNRDNQYRDYYIWQSPRYLNGNPTEPTNWASYFGGSCWRYDPRRKQYYMHIFSEHMPDLNWRNPKVSAEFIKIIKYWASMGVAGFRIDAAAHLGKAPFIDSEIPSASHFKPDWNKFSNLPITHSHLRYLNKEAFSLHKAVTVGEIGGNLSVEEGLKYVLPENRELNMIFTFDHNWCHCGSARRRRIDVDKLKAAFNQWQTGIYPKGWMGLYWLNHDHPRLLSHYGANGYYRKRSAKMLAVVLYFMKGTPFIYQGEEIGMTNPRFRSVGDFRDNPTINRYYYEKARIGSKKALRKIRITSRDNARSPMQWDKTRFGGFSRFTPWFITGKYRKTNVKSQIKKTDSILNFYRRIIFIRKNSGYRYTIVYGDYQPIEFNRREVMAYIRRSDEHCLLVLANFSRKRIKLDNSGYKIKQIILTNCRRKIFDFKLLPYEAIVLDIYNKGVNENES